MCRQKVLMPAAILISALLALSNVHASVSPDELGRLLLKQNYRGITQGFNVYYKDGPTGINTRGGWHPGIDYRAQTPLPVSSPVSGVVESMDPQGTGYGRVSIKISGTNDYFILLHLSVVTVKLRQKVSPGDIIGKTGSVGAPAHLHVEVRTGRSSAAYYFKSPNNTGVNKNPTFVINS